jgi:hypothetical protein
MKATWRCLLLLSVVLCGSSVSACAIVPAYQRGALADPAMDPRSDALERRSMRRMHTAREGAAGGDGIAAGGGCGCGN